MNEQQRNDALPVWSPLVTIAIMAGLGLVLWVLARKRGAPKDLVSAIVPSVPLVSPWSPLQ